jgi:hypothetical protein
MKSLLDLTGGFIAVLELYSNEEASWIWFPKSSEFLRF